MAEGSGWPAVDASRRVNFVAETICLLDDVEDSIPLDDAPLLATAALVRGELTAGVPATAAAAIATVAPPPAPPAADGDDDAVKKLWRVVAAAAARYLAVGVEPAAAAADRGDAEPLGERGESGDSGDASAE